MQKHHLAIKQLKTGIAAIIWIVLIAAGFANRERFSLARITAFVSARQNGAVFIMLLLFAFKSILIWMQIYHLQIKLQVIFVLMFQQSAYLNNPAFQELPRFIKYIQC